MEQTNYQGALQRPMGSGFGAASTSADVINGIDLAGKTAIVTGGYAGIGLETVKALASAGARVIVPARNVEKAKRSLAGIANVELEEVDLANAASIDGFADRFLASGRALHLLINNAGIMWAPLQRDERGNESQLSTNHLGHFQLTARLWSALAMARGARVVNVSSWGHHYSPVVFDDPNFLGREYQTLSAYGQSKTASTLFSLELDARGKGAGVRAYSVHPGIIAGTELSRNLPKEDLQKFGALDENHNPVHDLSKGLKTLSQGASTSVWCATSPALAGVGGVYCEDADIAQLDRIDVGDAAGVVDTSAMRGVAPHALDRQAAQRLWALSEQLSGTTFPLAGV